jgi:hypothetical protein
MRLKIVCLLIGLTSVCVQAGGSAQPRNPDAVPEGLPPSDWQSIRAAYEAGRHAFAPVEGGWQARNPGQQWTTTFDGRGFMAEPRDGGWQWGLELKSYGFPGAERAVDGEAVVKADGQRLTYDWDATVEEWFVNDTRGLEHGFTVRERPEGVARASSPQLDGLRGAPPRRGLGGGSAPPPHVHTSEGTPLTFTLRTRGTLHPRVSADAQSVSFQDASGATVLNYSGLKVWDADGKVLPSRFELADFQHSTLNSQPCLRLLVEEQGARYPLTIDPIAQQAYLKAHQVNADDRFGGSVSVSGDTVVVGASEESSSTTGVNSTPNESGTWTGAAYVFVRSGTTWTQQAYLKAHQVNNYDQFGISVAVSGDTVVVGARWESSSTTGVNSTPNENSDASGAAYVFVRSGTIWSQQAYLKAHQVNADDNFGGSVSVSGDTVVVGARGESSSTTGINSTPNESAAGAGGAYVFVRSGTNWTQEAYLKAHQVNPGDNFGNSVAVSGDTVVVGALFEDSSTTQINSLPNEDAQEAGAAYVFVRSGTNWMQQAYLKAGNAGAQDQFGLSVAVSGDTVVVGANLEEIDNVFSTGAAYVFVRDGTNWTQQAYLRAGNPGLDDQFGNSVAVSGDTLVVGSFREDSSTTGVNSTPNESALAAGAAYVFRRNGTNWSQQAYLKPDQINAGDGFGISVAVSGDTVMVGAPGEDSSTTGGNSTPNESAPFAGAAYVFTGFGPSPDADGDGLLDSWELTHWPTIIGHSALDDFDGDGYVELLELALGLNPKSPDPGGLPPVTSEGGYLTMTLTKQPGVTYEVQSAGTLLEGQPDSFSPASTTVLLNDATTLKVRDNQLIGTAPGRFLRVKVTAAP